MGNPRKIEPIGFEELQQTVYTQLRRAARRQLIKHAGVSLTPTEVVHEVFLKMRNNGELEGLDRSHWFAVASQCMRWLLTDYARGKRRQKRQGENIRIPFVEEGIVAPAQSLAIADLESALKELARLDPRACKVVELHYLCGLDLKETAAHLGISETTVKRDWNLARAWLRKELTPQGKGKP